MNIQELRNKNKYVSALLIAVILWAGSFTAIKNLISYYSSLEILAIRFLLSAIIIFVLFYKNINQELLRALKDKEIWLFTILNLFGFYFQTLGMAYTTASNAGFITAFSVLVVPFLLKIHYKTDTKFSYIYPIAISTVGLYLISFGFKKPDGVNIGDFYELVGSIFLAYYIVLLSRISKRYFASTIMFVAFLIMGVIAWFGLVFSHHASNLYMLMHNEFFWSMFYIVVFSGVIPFMLASYGQSNLSAQLAAITYLLEPIFAALIAYYFLGEVMSFGQIIGAVLMCLSLIMAVYLED